jgi:hypothetical protein
MIPRSRGNGSVQSGASSRETKALRRALLAQSGSTQSTVQRLKFVIWAVSLAAIVFSIVFIAIIQVCCIEYLTLQVKLNDITSHVRTQIDAGARYAIAADSSITVWRAAMSSSQPAPRTFAMSV